MENKETSQIQSLIKELPGLIDDLNNLSITRQDVNESAACNELATALSKAQAEFKVADKNKKNPFFKSNYADFPSIVAASRPALTKNGLSVIQRITVTEHQDQLLVTKLFHSSGQWIQSVSRITPMKTDVQSFSSYITYLKRITYTALIGVVTGDEDDDGEAAVASTRSAPYKQYTSPTSSYTKQDPNETISQDQLEELRYELADQPEITNMVLDGLKIKKLADMPKNKYTQSAQRIREIKNQRNGVK